MERRKKLVSLFFNMLYISAFTFGGGFVIVTLMKKKFVDKLHWLDEQEMLDMTAIAQSSPGAIAVNASILVGWKVGGALGAALAVLGTVIPPLVIMTLISLIYQAFAANRYVALVLKGMQAGVAAVIIDVVISMMIKLFKEKIWWKPVLLLAAFAASFFLNINVVFIILGAAIVGAAVTLCQQRNFKLRKRKDEKKNGEIVDGEEAQK